jgi:DNA-binding transcriptional LysR family regulator
MYLLIKLMDLKYEELQTFLEVHKSGTFTKAASVLGLSQSALSQKIARIEDVLQAAVFIRHPRSLSLTSSGEKLLIFAKEAVQMQTDFLATFNQYQEELSGVIRIAGFSSVMRSIVIPKVSNFLRKNPKVSIEFSSHEMFELEGILKSNRADFIITDYFPHLSQSIETQISEEEYVIIESKKIKKTSDTYLDHGPLDNATESYFKYIGKNQEYKRLFMGDVYSIIDGVSLGLGKAVMSKHLIENDKRFKIIEHKKRYIRPIVMTYIKQNYYSPLHSICQNLLS